MGRFGNRWISLLSIIFIVRTILELTVFPRRVCRRNLVFWGWLISKMVYRRAWRTSPFLDFSLSVSCYLLFECLLDILDQLILQISYQLSALPLCQSTFHNFDHRCRFMPWFFQYGSGSIYIRRAWLTLRPAFHCIHFLGRFLHKSIIISGTFWFMFNIFSSEWATASERAQYGKRAWLLQVSVIYI